MKKNLNLISYFGGKYPHLDWLIPLFPKGDYHFADLMCGSANVALNVNYPLITINDLNENVINLFQVLRDHQQEFIEKIYFTPFARAELYKILDAGFHNGDKIEWARQYYVRCQLGYGANGSQNNNRGLGFEYSVSRSNYYKVDGWNSKLEKLPQIIDKLRKMQIECVDALKLFKKLDRKKTILFFDPPYLKSTYGGKKFLHDVDDAFHSEMCETALKIKKAYVCITGYEDAEKFYDKSLPGFFKTVAPVSKSNTGKREVRECAWTNYDPRKLNGQMIIFE